MNRLGNLKLLAALTAIWLGLASVAQAEAQPENPMTSEAKPPIRPDVEAFLKVFLSRPRPPMSDEGVKMMRAIPPETMAQMMQGIELPVGELAVDRKLAMPGPAGTLDLRLFDPRAERAPGPVVVFYHGGGFVAGNTTTHAPLAAEIARQLDLPVVSVEYRLAPEAKWPAAPDDAEAAARWVAANGEALGRSATALVLSGDSAGGTLTLLTALALRDKSAAVPVALMIPLYPMADGSKKYASGKQFADGYGLSSADSAFYDRAYAPDMNSPRHSALLAELAGLPPTVLVTAGLDPLRDGGRAFAAKLAQSGVPVSYHEVPGMIHGFATYRRGIASAQGELDHAMALARAMLERSEAK
jgi:acetyl esterase